MKYGYNGKVLHVNLWDRTFLTEEPDELFYRKYMGSGVMAAVYLLKNTKPNIDPLSEENPLMFFSSVISGQDAPGLARFTICAKSPLTGGIGEARSEGPFAMALKKSGFDGIIINGKCENPSLLVIDHGKPSIVPAEHLWGKNVSECVNLIEEQYPGASTALIGIAGENKVRFANVITNRCHQASRAGLGAVMGAKNIKGVVLLGGQLPPVYDEQALAETKEWFDKTMRSNVLSMWQHDRPGFGVWIHTHGIDASVCVNNFQTSKCDYVNEYAPEQFEDYYNGVSSCPGCPNDCIKRYAPKEADSRSGGLHQEALGAFGPNMGLSDVHKIVFANVLCNEYGMDPNSLGYTISFAQECVQRGLLKDDGLNFSFSSEVDILAIIEAIAKREGVGHILAEGSYRAAEQIGKGAEKYAMTVKKNELNAFECRSQTNLALGYATAPTGPRYEICEHDWDFDTHFGWDHTLNYCYTIGITERIEMEYVGKKKVRNFVALNTLWSATDALGLCLFASAPTRVYSLNRMAKLLHDVTGFETSSYEIMRLGELRNQIFRIYNVREGLRAADDRLPDRMYEQEIDFGAKKGCRIDRQAFEEVIKCYYGMMGWDEDGVPTESTLYAYGLEWTME